MSVRLTIQGSSLLVVTENGKKNLIRYLTTSVDGLDGVEMEMSQSNNGGFFLQVNDFDIPQEMRMRMILGVKDHLMSIGIPEEIGDNRILNVMYAQPPGRVRRGGQWTARLGMWINAQHLSTTTSSSNSQSGGASLEVQLAQVCEEYFGKGGEGFNTAGMGVPEKLAMYRVRLRGLTTAQASTEATTPNADTTPTESEVAQADTDASNSEPAF